MDALTIDHWGVIQGECEGAKLEDTFIGAFE